MRYIFIRHDEKEYPNGRGNPKFDSPIKQDVPPKNEVFENVREIICSPYLRCRETAARQYPHIEPAIDPRIREYLGHWSVLDQMHFYPETWEQIYYLPNDKSPGDLKVRLFNFVLELEKTEKNHDVLVVTHGFCLQMLFDIFRKFGHYPKRLPTEGFEIIMDNKI